MYGLYPRFVYLLALSTCLSMSPSQTAAVELNSLGTRTVGDLRLSTAVLTPNGDGINDLLDIDFDLVNLSSPVPVSVDVFTLSGACVAELSVERFGSGPHRVERVVSVAY